MDFSWEIRLLRSDNTLLGSWQSAQPDLQILFWSSILVATEDTSWITGCLMPDSLKNWILRIMSKNDNKNDNCLSMMIKLKGEMIVNCALTIFQF